jgi:ABC-type transport system involved in multi-copper enzyme maturation permease subunit
MSIETGGSSMETTAPVSESQPAAPRRGWFQWFLDNPVILKEFRGRMRGRQAFILLTTYLGLIAIFIGVLYTFLAQSSSSMGWDPSFRQTAGKTIFGAVVLLELLLVGFIGPGLTSGAISSERERQTFDLLRTTLLSAHSLVLGKLGAAFTYLFLLILTALPIQSLAFLLGGVGIGEMLVAGLLLVVTALFFCTLGIFFSSFMKRTLPATLGSYGTILLSIIFLVIIFFLIAMVETAFYISENRVRDLILTVVLWALISTNPFIAAVMSEVILQEDQNLFFTTSSPFSGDTIFLPSPWILYVVFYTVLTVVMIVISILRVRRPDH